MRTTRLALIFLIATAILAWLTASSTYSIQVQMNGTASDLPELFFASDTSEFSANNSLRLKKDVNAGSFVSKWTLPRASSITKIRLDPTKLGGQFHITSIELTGPAGTQKWQADLLIEANKHDLFLVSQTDRQLVFNVVGDDPQLLVDVDKSVTGWNTKLWITHIFVVALVATSLLVIAKSSFAAVKREHRLIRSLNDKLEAACSFISDTSTASYSKSSLVVLLSLVALFFVLTSLKAHQSSIGIWDGLYGNDRVSRLIELGTPKAIRSDEWNTQTPWILNQVLRGQSPTNTNIGGGKSPLLTSTPIDNWILLAQPKFWGFALFDLERGFAWLWGYKLIGLLSSFFVLLLVLTKGNTLLSLAGALWVLGSSFTQWWYSSHLPEILIGFALGVAGALYLLLAQKKGGVIFGGILILFSICSLLLHAYPAFIIPLAYLGVFIVAGVVIERHSQFCRFTDPQYRIFIACASLLASFLFVAAWWSLSKETVDLMLNTVYPGKRYDLGGEMQTGRLWYGFFEAMRSTENEYPLPPTNASEASSFLLLFPLLIFLIKPRDLLAPQNALVAFTLAYCFVTLAWMSFPLPQSLRELVAMLGWGMTTSNRAEIGIGIASILSIVTWMSVVCTEQSAASATKTHRQVIIVFAFGLAIFSFGLWLQTQDPNYFTLSRLFLGTALSLGIIASLVFKSSVAFFLSLLAFISQSLMVNPLHSGLGSIFDKPVLNSAAELGGSHNDRWAVLGGLVLSQGLKARGLDVATGTHFAPSMKYIDTLDPSHEFKHIWNRYAHVVYISDPNTPNPRFELLNTDIYSVSLNVCDPKTLKALGINRLVYTEAVPDADLRCLKRLGPSNADGIVFFEFK